MHEIVVPMLPPSEIVYQLIAIANAGIPVAFGWHVVLASAVVALAHGWRPTHHLARAALAGPLVSVAIFAFVFGNRFTGIVIGGTAIALGTLALATGDRARVAPAPTWVRSIGAALVAYSWVYPHFLHGSALAYLYAAPIGVVPCPTLALAIGMALVGNGLGSRSWGLVLAAIGLFYGVFGVMVLGVMLDLGLVAGAAVLATIALGQRVTPAEALSSPS